MHLGRCQPQLKRFEHLTMRTHNCECIHGTADSICTKNFMSGKASKNAQSLFPHSSPTETRQRCDGQSYTTRQREKIDTSSSTASGIALIFSESECTMI